jgi:cation transport ATPase
MLAMPRRLQGALLLLLFQLSHILEEKFTAKAEVSLERLFSAVPQQVLLSLPEMGTIGGSSIRQVTDA